MQIKLIFFFLIFLSSCASRCVEMHSRASLHVADSLARTTRLAIRSSSVPESRAALQIPTADLRALPPAAVYTAKNGQATATVRFLHDTLFVTASCDSLQQLVYEYEQQIEQSSHSEQNKSQKSDRRSVAPGFIFGFLLSCVAFLFLNHLFRGFHLPGRS